MMMSASTTSADVTPKFKAKEFETGPYLAGIEPTDDNNYFDREFSDQAGFFCNDEGCWFPDEDILTDEFSVDLPEDIRAQLYDGVSTLEIIEKAN